MKKLTISIFTAMLLTLATFSQQTFYTQIKDNNFHKPWDILIKSDGNMLFCSYYEKNNDSKSSIYELDDTGEIINEWTFTGTNLERFECTQLLEVNNHLYLFGEGQRTTQGNLDVFISMRKLDMQLNVVENHEYKFDGLSCDRLIPGRVIYRDTTFHVLSQITIGQWESPSYFKIGLSGFKHHSAYHISSIGQVLLPFDFYLSPESDNLFTVSFDWMQTLNAFGVFTEFDPQLTIVSQFPIPEKSILSYNLLQQSDTSMYLASNKFDATNLEFSSMVNNIDRNGNVLNQFIFECNEDSASRIAHFNSLDTLADGNMILCTTHNLDEPFNVQHEPTKIMLFKLSPTLNLIWQKYLFGEKGMYEAYGVKAHPDGGIVVLGAYSPTPPTNPDIKEVFLMKTDSDGLLTGIENEKQKITSTEAIIYPNPAREQITVDFSRLYNSATLQLMDISGKTVFISQLTSNRQTIDISALPAGTYVYKIFNQKGLEETGKLVVE